MIGQPRRPVLMVKCRYDRIVNCELTDVIAVPIVLRGMEARKTNNVSALGVLVVNNSMSTSPKACEAQLCFCAAAVGVGLHAARYLSL